MGQRPFQQLATDALQAKAAISEVVQEQEALNQALERGRRAGGPAVVRISGGGGGGGAGGGGSIQRDVRDGIGLLGEIRDSLRGGAAGAALRGFGG